MKSLTLAWMLLTLAGASEAGRQTAMNPEEAYAVQAAWWPGTGVRVWVQAAPGYLLYRDRLRVTAMEGFKGRSLDMPEPDWIEGTEGPVAVYRDLLIFDVEGEREEGTGRIELQLQGCAEEGVCFQPWRMSIPVR